MTRPSTPPILSELRKEPSLPANYVKALRDLKNEIIGHEEKKRLWVGLEVVTCLARILRLQENGSKTKQWDTNGTPSRAKIRGARSETEEARLQAIAVVGSLACGGPKFLAPLNAGHVLGPLISLVSPSESHPTVVLQALTTLNTIADSAQLSSPGQSQHQGSLSSLLYTKQGLSNLSSVLRQDAFNSVIRQQIELAASLICKTCQPEKHCALLARSDVLEALAVNIAPSLVASCMNALNVPFADNVPPRLSILLRTASLIIKNSRARALQFVGGAAFAAAFAFVGSKSFVEQDSNGSPRKSPASQVTFKLLESLIPQLPNSLVRTNPSTLSSHGAIGSTNAYTRSSGGSHSLSTAIEVFQNQKLEFVGEDESPLVPWLFHVFRSRDRVTSLTAAELIIQLNRLGLVRRSRESMLALLLIPPIVSMLDKETRVPDPAESVESGVVADTEREFIQEVAPAVLGTLMSSDNLEAQKAAAEAGAIKKLSQLLKSSFDPLPPTTSSSLWYPTQEANVDMSDTDDSSRLGEGGISRPVYHTLRLREAILAALAAIASDKDEYRKEIIDNGVISFVVRTLKMEPVETNTSLTHRDANPAPGVLQWYYKDVVLAACGASRALSRSVSTLRTSLMDAGLATPLFVLLKSQDVDIQVAATAVVCNLVLKFSPMRQAIMDGGILTIICDHAHGTNAKLRLNSLWALKHVIAGATNGIKIACLDKLSPDWLKNLVLSDIEQPSSASNYRALGRDNGAASPVKMSTPNAAGEQVDLLNAVDDASRTFHGLSGDDGDEDLKMADSNIPLARKDESDTRMPSAGTMQANADGPFAPRAHCSPSDEFAIQKEGLEIIRNLLCGENSHEMIDYLFREMGQDNVFEMLASKLRPRVVNAFNRDRRTTGGGIENGSSAINASATGMRQIHPRTEIVVSVCYTLVHIAAGQPRQRTLMAHQTQILQLLVPMFSHPSRDIRSCCAWFVINLTWVENIEDKLAARTRAKELMRVGFLEKLEAMEKDEALDCRERGKTARDQMRALLAS